MKWTNSRENQQNQNMLFWKDLNIDKSLVRKTPSSDDFTGESIEHFRKRWGPFYRHSSLQLERGSAPHVIL